MGNRLLTKIRKMEGQAAKREVKAEIHRKSKLPWGVIWMERDPEAAVLELGEDDEVVLDYYVVSEGQGSTTARCVERIAAGPEDLGVVYNSAGVKIGVVQERDGHVVTLDYDRGLVGGAASADGGGDGR